jgi:hypothetical protein
MIAVWYIVDLIDQDHDKLLKLIGWYRWQRYFSSSEVSLMPSIGILLMISLVYNVIIIITTRLAVDNKFDNTTFG